MSVKVVIAKLTRPCLHQAFRRGRLFELIDAQRVYPAIWISAPPGAGKTTLVASYLEARNLPGIWYQIERSDADPAAFFNYLSQTNPSPVTGHSPLPLFQPEHMADLAGFAGRFFREVYSRFDIPAVMVLDNYQEVPPDAALHTVMVQAVEQIPKRVNLIIISRTGPSSHFARQRANALLGHIPPEALHFDRDETAALANARGQIEVATLDTLHARAQGWAAGVVLLAEHVRRTGTLEHVDSSESMETLFAYFAHEIFNQMSAGECQFLLRTAFLPKTTVAMAEALSGDRNAGSMLESLYRQHWFTDRLNGSCTYYQYHALFREFLIAHAVKTLTIAELSLIKRDAASLLVDNSEPEPAVVLLADIGDWPTLTSLICGKAQVLLAQGRYVTLLDWIDRVPEAVIAAIPWLLFWRGRAQMVFDPPGSLPHLERAFALFSDHADPVGLFSAWAGVGTAIIWDVSGDMRRLDPWMGRLAQLRTEYADFSHPDIDWLVAHTAMSILCLRKPTHPVLDYWEQRSLSLARQSGNIVQFLPSLQMALHRHMVSGDLTQAARRMAEYPGLTEIAPHEPSIGFWYFGKAQFHFTLGDFETCLQTVSDGLAASHNSGIHLWDHQLLAPGISSALALDRTALAKRLLKQLASDSRTRTGNAGLFYHLCVKVCASACGASDRALVHARIAVELADAAWSIYAGVARIGLALALHDHGNPVQASHALTTALIQTRALGSRILEHVCLMIEADFAFTANDHAAGDAALREGLRLGCDDRYVSFIFWRKDMMARLCARALEIGIEVDYVQHMIRVRQLRAPSPHIEAWPWPVKVYTLGRFSVVVDGQPISFARKTQKKPLALLQALIALGGREIDEWRLAQALTDENSDSLGTVAMTLSRLRKLLVHADAVTLNGGKLSINPGLCWVDAWAFERGLSALAHPITGSETIEKTLRLYNAPFLQRELEQPWILHARERLHRKFLQGLHSHCQQLEKAKDWQAAIAWYQRGIESDPAGEELYRRLMHCHARRGEPADAIKTYQRCRSMLSIHLGITPSAETEALRQRLTGSLPG